MEMIKEHFPQIAALAKKGGKGALFMGRQYLASPQRKAILAEILKQKQGLPNFLSISWRERQQPWEQGLPG